MWTTTPAVRGIQKMRPQEGVRVAAGVVGEVADAAVKAVMLRVNDINATMKLSRNRHSTTITKMIWKWR